MSKRKSCMRNSGRVKRHNDLSNHTLMMMVILVLVVSVLSAAMYVYAFYGSGSYTKIQKSSSPFAEQKPVASGMATIQIIEPPEGK